MGHLQFLRNVVNAWLLGSLITWIPASAQTTICSGGCPSGISIPDGGCPTPTTSTINVTGVGTIDNTFGLVQVCVYITHTWRSDIDMYLVAPDGTRIELSTDNGSLGDDFGTGCSTGQMLCFDVNATTSITSWGSTDPATGTYQPEGCLGAVNNGQNADGTWTLEVCDDLGGDNGAIEGWCLVFDNNPPVPQNIQYNCTSSNDNFPNCHCIQPGPSNFIGQSSSSYTEDEPGNFGSEFCGSTDNNQWFCFNAPASTVTFDFLVSNCTNAWGVQAEVYSVSGNLCSPTFTSVSNCWNPTTETNGTVTASGLIPGQVYVLMVDGYAGDVCDFEIVNWQPGALPLEGISLTGKVSSNGEHILKWTTIITENDEVNGIFAIERYSPESGRMEVLTEVPIENKDTFTYIVYPEKGMAVATYRVVAYQEGMEQPVFSNTITLRGTYDGIPADITYSTGTKGIVIYAWEPVILNLNILSLSGKLLNSYSHQLNGNQTTTVSLGSLPPGSYFIQVYDHYTGSKRTIPFVVY
ncbi:MAG: hypothetical protein GXO48_05720 [Chlorobi bacterium]|nr:hypothetical protein [Chlorobiota bacterium]